MSQEKLTAPVENTKYLSRRQTLFEVSKSIIAETWPQFGARYSKIYQTFDRIQDEIFLSTQLAREES